MRGCKVTFGKRVPTNEAVAVAVAVAVAANTCAKCRGTGRVRERGSPIVCKACAGTGAAAAQRLPEAETSFSEADPT